MNLTIENIKQIVPVMDYMGDNILPLCSNCGECILEHTRNLSNDLMCNNLKDYFDNPNLSIKEMKLIAEQMR